MVAIAAGTIASLAIPYLINSLMTLQQRGVELNAQLGLAREDRAYKEKQTKEDRRANAMLLKKQEAKIEADRERIPMDNLIQSVMGQMTQQAMQPNPMLMQALGQMQSMPGPGQLTTQFMQNGMPSPTRALNLGG